MTICFFSKANKYASQETAKCIQIISIILLKVKYYIHINNQIDNIILEMKKISKELKFVSMSRSEENTTINLDIRPKNFQNLTKFSGVIKKKYKNSKVILSYNDELSL